MFGTRTGSSLSSALRWGERTGGPQEKGDFSIGPVLIKILGGCSGGEKWRTGVDDFRTVLLKYA